MHSATLERRDERQPVDGVETTAGRREYRGVQALRAIAALLVVASHGTDFLEVRNGWVPAGLAWFHGAVGVDIFFVISGFVITVSSVGMAGRSGTFLWRRVVRIVPLYWMLTALRVALVSAWPALSVQRWPGWWNVLASFLFLPSYAAPGLVQPVIAVGWTLNFEMLFYAVFAIALAVRSGLYRVLTPAMLVIGLIGIFRPYDGPAWTMEANPIVFEFLAGVCIALLAKRGKLPNFGVAVACMALGAAGFVTFGPASKPVLRVATWGVSALLVVVAAVAMESRIGRRIPQWVLLLGDASYSIYLIQSFVLPVMHRGMNWLAPDIAGRAPLAAGLWSMAGGVALTAVAGIVVYRWIERPVTQLLRRKSGEPKPMTVAG